MAQQLDPLRCAKVGDPVVGKIYSNSKRDKVAPTGE